MPARSSVMGQVVQERFADPVARAAGEHRNLLSIVAAVDTIGDRRGSRDVGRIDRHPGQAALLIPDESTEGGADRLRRSPAHRCRGAPTGCPLDVL